MYVDMEKRMKSGTTRLLSKTPFPLGPDANRRQRVTAFLFIVIVAGIGTYLLTKSFAAAPISAVEPEKGTVSAGATLGSDSTASGGQYVKFGNSVSANDPIIVADGDIACDPAASGFNGGSGSGSSCVELATSDLAISLNPTAVLALGDNVYECGGLSAFQTSYGPSWGRLKSITHPAVGNHEFITGGTVNGVPATDCDATGKAMGYANYFGAAAGSPGHYYYSYDVGTWHLMALDSDCSQEGGCTSGTPQYTWLQNDIKAHTNQCLLAYFHHPLYSRDTSGGTANLAGQPFWQLLYAAGADVVLNGHSHNYQRFTPMNASGGVDNSKGILELVTGAGGANHTPFDVTDTAAQFAAKYPSVTPGLNQPIPLVSNNTDFGVLALTLHSHSFDYKFYSVTAGGFSDASQSSIACHN